MGPHGVTDVIISWDLAVKREMWKSWILAISGYFWPSVTRVMYVIRVHICVPRMAVVLSGVSCGHKVTMWVRTG